MALFDTLPYNDDYMTYDAVNHFYVLTPKAMLDNLGENLDAGALQSSNDVLIWLKRVSRIVRRYVFELSQRPEFVQAMLATDKDLRPLVLEMLLAQAEEELRPSDHEDVLKAGGIARDVQAIANRVLPRYGFAMRYSGLLPCVPPDRLYKGW